MASIYRDNARKGWRAQVYVSGHRRKLWIGDVNKLAAATIANHLQALATAKETATSIPPATEDWVQQVGERLKDQLLAWGLVEKSSLHEMPRTLRAFCDAYLASRTDYSTNTKERWQNVINKLCKQLGNKTALKAINAGDADRFARWARSELASSHAGKIIKDCRQLMGEAIKYKIISSNPFDGISTKQEHDEEREAYISREMTDLLIKHAPDARWRALIAFARYCGPRVPSEPLNLKWTDIDWDAGRIRISKQKSKVRVCPLFAELRPHLEEWQELAPDGAVYVFDRNRTSAATKWREQLESIIEKAGLEQWPKLWQNIRASCRTDLDEHFPAKVVNSWLGHGTAIAQKHYARVTAEHFDKAIRGVAGGVVAPISADSHRRSSAKKTNEKPAKAPKPRG
jgi:integrase